MAKGKKTCKILKDIRKQIAEENDIQLITEECTYKGDCLGTCPRCEAEVRYLERELEKRQRLGKVAVFAGMSLGTIMSAASCDSTEPITKKEPLAGDVTTEVIVPPQPVDPDTVIEEPLMGIVPWYHNVFFFDEETYESLLKDLFVYPDMEKLTVIKGKLPYEHLGDGSECNTLEKLVAETREFSAPSYPGGEQQMLKDIAEGLKGKPIYGRYKGVMEVAFNVTPEGNVEGVRIENGLDVNLDAAVIALFEQMRWNPARYKLENGDSSVFECRCIQKIVFPLK